MPTTTKPAAPKPAIKKLNLGGIAAKKKEAASYPALPVTPESSALVSELIAETEELEALKGSVDLKKATIKATAQRFFFAHLHGKHDIPSSVEATGENPDDKILISFANRYSTITDETPIIDLIGPERTAAFFRQAFELKVDGDKIPAAHTESLIEEIQELFAKYEATDALSAKAVIKPTPDFHAARHTALSVEENLTLDTLCPIIAMVKTKGRKK